MTDLYQRLDHSITVVDTGFVRPQFDASFLVVESGRAAFIESLKQTFADLYGSTPGTVSADVLAEAEALVESKFATREWIYRVP